jgi:hypothetical protein
MCETWRVPRDSIITIRVPGSIALRLPSQPVLETWKGSGTT